MIQRIQTVYLLLVTVLLIVTMCLPLGSFVMNNIPDEIPAVVYPFNAWGVTTTEGLQSTWGLLGLLLLGTIISLATIFLYKNRILQIRMTVFNTLILIGFYIVAFIFWSVFKNELDPESFRVGFATGLPLVAIILNYLAIRAIGKDEVMVKAADRLR